VVEFLKEQGYQVLHQRWRAGRLGELDVVAVSACGGYLVGVEVKTRRPQSIETGLYPDSAKLIRLSRVMEAFLLSTEGQPHAGRQPRIDWALVILQPKGEHELHYYENIVT
jgi:Holliday junction resolvase-like predicted endonuclease